MKNTKSNEEKLKGSEYGNCGVASNFTSFIDSKLHLIDGMLTSAQLTMKRSFIFLLNYPFFSLCDEAGSFYFQLTLTKR